MSTRKQRSSQAPIIKHILRDPVYAMWEPIEALSGYSVSEFEEAHKYFSENAPERYVYGVSTALFHIRIPDLDKQLIRWGLARGKSNRFWPFWRIADEYKGLNVRRSVSVKDYLLRLWNESVPYTASGSGLMYMQTGKLSVRSTRVAGGCMFFSCSVETQPVMNPGNRRYPGSFTIAFDTRTRAFFSMNCRVKADTADVLTRHVEIIDPGLEPPNMATFEATPPKGKWQLLLVLDHHIGDSLSLMSTYVEAISKLPHIELTVNTFRCTFLNTITEKHLKRIFPGRSVRLVNTPPDPFAYDLVLDPYDVVPGIFEKKPQNESAQMSIVSALELAMHFKRNERRDILDIHRQSLKRLGFLPDSQKLPFLRYHPYAVKKKLIQKKARAALIDLVPVPNTGIIVTIFAMGLETNRKYPAQRLRQVLTYLLAQENVYIVLSGEGPFDQQLTGSAVSGQLPNEILNGKDRILYLFGKPFGDVMNLICASNIIVAMDSGPLHLSRICRTKPIALYTNKVNDPQRFMAFPWYVDDGSVEALLPDQKEHDPHVPAKKIIAALRQRIKGIRKLRP